MCQQMGVDNPAQCKGTEAGVESKGVVIKTWDQLLQHMDDVSEKGRQMIKKWMKMKNGEASAMQIASMRSASAVAGKVFVASSACEAADAEHRAAFQAKLNGVCAEMCSELGVAECTCPGASDQPAARVNPSAMTWPQLVEHMDNLVEWGLDTLKGFHVQASHLQVKQHVATYASEDLRRRAQVQNKLAGVCSEMCANLGADQQECSRKCANHVTPDSTPGVVTWEELMQHMDDLSAWGGEQIKGWHAQRAGSR